MNKEEMKLLNKIDTICSNLGISYTIEVEMGIGTRVTIYLTGDKHTKNTRLIFGGLDWEFDRSISEAIETLSKIRIEH